MDVLVTNQRQTKYCKSIQIALRELGHATNAELLNIIKQQYPEVSATTVHRASARLADRGLIAIAPSAIDGSMRYDTNINSHDHFQCSACGRLLDANVKDKVIDMLEDCINGCTISGRLTINGICKNCMKGQNL